MEHIQSQYQSNRGCIIYNEKTERYQLAPGHEGTLGFYDWGVDLDSSPSRGDQEVVLVQFKNQRTEYYINSNLLTLQQGDVVTVNAQPGHDVGIVAATGWLAQRCFRHKNNNHYLRCIDRPREWCGPTNIYRLATVNDVQRWMQHVASEADTLVRVRELLVEVNLQIKVSDVEYQGDGSRLTVYYSSSTRVDFRAYVRLLSEILGCKIIMRQYNNRQEASIVGGIGACGRSLCCATWMHQLESVVTADIKMQELALHYQRYAGQCEKLKCCLKFELDTYAEAQARFPRVKSLKMAEGVQLYHIKNDLFNDIMWFSPKRRGTYDLISFSIEQVKEILQLNAQGKEGGNILELQTQMAEKEMQKRETEFVDILEEESITRFDSNASTQKTKKRSKRRRKRKTAKASDNQNAAEQEKERSDNKGNAQTSSKRNKTARRRPRTKRNANARKDAASQRTSNRIKGKGSSRAKTKNQDAQSDEKTQDH